MQAIERVGWTDRNIRAIASARTNYKGKGDSFMLAKSSRRKEGKLGK